MASKKSLLAANRGKMTTRSVTTEILFNLSSSKNITDSLQKFGIGDNDRDLLAIVIGDSEGEELLLTLLRIDAQNYILRLDKSKLTRLRDLVKGEVKDLDEISEVVDVDNILKVHKLKNIPSEVISDKKALANLLISKSAAKDLTL